VRVTRPLLALIALVLATGLMACGSAEQAPPPVEPAAARPADFPSADGKTLAGLTKGLPEGPVLAPSTSQLLVGSNRFGFALFDTAHKQVEANAVAVYTARKDGTGLRGPYPAHRESFAVKPPYRSAEASSDLANGDSFYVAGLTFKHAANLQALALARMDGRLVKTNPFELPVHAGGGPPAVGDKAIPMHTLTPEDVGGDLGRIDTRVPAAKDLLTTDLADVLGKKPVVLLFATPALCASRVCGPVTDIVEQVRAETGDGVAFIHQEIYRDNKISEGVRPQVEAWRLPSEPWMFVIDRTGRITARFEGAFSAGELERAVAKVRGKAE
jgi:hypothetical protein